MAQVPSLKGPADREISYVNMVATVNECKPGGLKRRKVAQGNLRKTARATIVECPCLWSET